MSQQKGLKVAIIIKVRPKIFKEKVRSRGESRVVYFIETKAKQLKILHQLNIKSLKSELQILENTFASESIILMPFPVARWLLTEYLTK